MLNFIFRAMAVCIVFIIGRIGSIISSNVVGHLLESHCNLTFNLFGAAALSIYTNSVLYDYRNSYIFF